MQAKDSIETSKANGQGNEKDPGQAAEQSKEQPKETSITDKVVDVAKNVGDTMTQAIVSMTEPAKSMLGLDTSDTSPQSSARKSTTGTSKRRSDQRSARKATGDKASNAASPVRGSTKGRKSSGSLKESTGRKSTVGKSARGGKAVTGRLVGASKLAASPAKRRKSPIGVSLSVGKGGTGVTSHSEKSTARKSRTAKSAARKAAGLKSAAAAGPTARGSSARKSTRSAPVGRRLRSAEPLSSKAIVKKTSGRSGTAKKRSRT